MDKIYVPVTSYCIGEVLAKEVITDSGATLVAKNTIINSFIKNRLIERKITNIWLYNKAVLLTDETNNAKCKPIEESYKESIQSIKRILNDVAAGCMIDYQKILGITNMITGGIKENSQIKKCILEINSADEYTYTHCINVALYSMLIAKWLKLPEHKLQEAFQAGLLHDIGKIKIASDILNKKGSLTIEEFHIIEEHSLLGYNVLKDIPELSEDVKMAVLLHHERMDGSGYPYGLSGEAIELLARIVSIADVYDAMTQNRIYKSRATPFDAFEMFLAMGIRLFDTKIVNTFLKNISTFYVGANVTMSNDDIGEIVYIPPHNITKPTIHVGSNYIDMSNECGLKVSSLL